MMIVKNVVELRKKSEPVASVEEATRLIDKLGRELENCGNGIGLAAVQIGEPKQVGVIRQKNKKDVVLINPVVIEKEDEFVFVREGCLSFPGDRLDTNRHRGVIIDNQKIVDGEFVTERQYFYYGEDKDDLTAIAVQHEIDHFDGKIIEDIKAKPIPSVVRSDVKVGRNDPCPCGSGKKYKKCCS